MRGFGEWESLATWVPKAILGGTAVLVVAGIVYSVTRKG
jgi:hypothetical protein